MPRPQNHAETTPSRVRFGVVLRFRGGKEGREEGRPDARLGEERRDERVPDEHRRIDHEVRDEEGQQAAAAGEQPAEQ